MNVLFFVLRVQVYYSPFSYTVYNAVGLCAFELYDDMDYDSWYQTQLLKELSIRDPRSVFLSSCPYMPFQFEH